MEIHYLDIKSNYFNDILHNNKTFEIRRDIKNYKIGDILYLKEIENDVYTGRYLMKKIIYISDLSIYNIENILILGFNETI